MKPPNQNLYILSALVVMMIVPVYFFGARPLLVMAIAISTALLCDLIFKKLLFKFPKTSSFDLSSVITALIVTLLMPASIDYFIVISAVFWGLLIGKYVFGGTSKNIFNPAAVGVAIVAISYPSQLLKYPATSQILPLASNLDQHANVFFLSSPAYTLGVGGTPQINLLSLLLGDFPGMMGATCMVILLGVGLFLCVSRVISYRVILSSCVTLAMYAFLFPRSTTGRVDSMIFEFTSGVFLFGVIFMASAPHTFPHTRNGEVLYGIFLSLAMMLFRTFGAIEVEFLFVLLFSNALVTEFDRLGDWLSGLISRIPLFAKRRNAPPVPREQTDL